MMRFFVTVAAAVLLVSATGISTAQVARPSDDDIIATRQGGMALTGSVAEWMKAAVTSGADVKQFEEPAAALAEWGAAYPHLFPDGTQTGHDTKAKAEIWTDRAGFEKVSANFVTASTHLAEVAKSGDKAAFAEAWKAEGATCGACHRAYKNK